MPRTRPSRLAALFLGFASLAPAARAADAPPAKKAFGVDDLWAVQRVGTPVLSRDGARAAYAVTAYEGEEMKANADIWLVDVASGASRRLDREQGVRHVAGVQPRREAPRVPFQARR